MIDEDRVQKAGSRRTPKLPRSTSRVEARGTLDRLVGRIEARRGTNVGAAFRAGGLVRHMRKEAGLSQRELAEALGVSQARISEVEAGLGSQGPTWALMERIASACGREVGLVSAEPPVDLVFGPIEAGLTHDYVDVEIAPRARTSMAYAKALAAAGRLQDFDLEGFHGIDADSEFGLLGYRKRLKNSVSADTRISGGLRQTYQSFRRNYLGFPDE